MEFSGLKSQVKVIGFDELRAEGENYLEVVVLKGKIEEVSQKLEEFFGPPAFPSQKQLSPEIEDAVNKLGGIMPGQTLYHCRQDNNNIFAMLWPWGSGQHVTVKIIRQ